MAGRRRRVLVTLLLGAVATSCSWQQFDDLERRAPVRALPPPSDMTVVDYPVWILPSDAPRANAELVVIGENENAPSLAHFSFGADGVAAAETVPRDLIVLPEDAGAAAGQPVTDLEAATLLPGTPEAPVIALVASGQPLLLTLAHGQTPFAVTLLGDRLTSEAGAIAASPPSGPGANDNDIFIASGSQLHVLPDRGRGTELVCDVQRSGTVIGVGETAGERWVVVGTGLDMQMVVLDGACVDPTTPLVPPDLAGGFPAALLVTPDLDGDGAPEIVASAPGDATVHVFTTADPLAPERIAVVTGHACPLAGAPPGLRCVTAEGATSEFGASLAFGELDGRWTVVIGDPGPEGAAGAVWLYQPGAPAPLSKLERPSASVVNFGAVLASGGVRPRRGGVGVMPFVTDAGDRADLLLVSANPASANDPGVVYVYYRVSDDLASDPRVF